MPLGATVRIDGAAKSLEVLEAAVEPASRARGAEPAAVGATTDEGRGGA